ncbi:MAG TPA: transcriptional regulator [Methanosarcinales archaeon]|nr:transcriptional regulator [Methanosarcinales archaeon]
MTNEEHASIKEQLEEILERLKEINDKLDRIITVQIKTGTFSGKTLSALEENPSYAMVLLELPDHLRKTLLALIERGTATAEDISKVTNRERAVESSYLNQLARMDYLDKRRDGKKVYFSLKTED